MAKLYIAFHDNGVVRDMTTEPLEGYLPAPSKATSTLALRYGLQEGKVVDHFPGSTDEAVLIAVKTQQDEEYQRQQALMPNTIAKLTFFERFTREERLALRAAISSHPVAADLFALLDLTEQIDLRNQDLIANVQDLEASGLLATGRAEALLA